MGAPSYGVDLCFYQFDDLVHNGVEEAAHLGAGDFKVSTKDTGAVEGSHRGYVDIEFILEWVVAKCEFGRFKVLNRVLPIDGVDVVVVTAHSIDEELLKLAVDEG